MNQIERLTKIKAAPISWKERDLLTAVEKYMVGAIDFPLIKYLSPCFPKIKAEDCYKIEQV